MSEDGAYMYAVGRGIEPAALRDLAGIRGAPLRLVEHSGLGAVVSTVDLDEFGDDGLRRNLEDLRWLEDVARSHDSVVAGVSRFGSTVPLRFATICFDDDAVRQRLSQWRDDLTTSLDRVEGRLEWGVKVYDVAAAVTPEVAPADQSGTAYLTRRRAEQHQQTIDSEAAEVLADRIHETIRGQVVASRRLPPQDPRLTGHDEMMTLNGTYLVDRDRAEGLNELVTGLAAEHPEARIELSGPWPPYSFATLESP